MKIVTKLLAIKGQELVLTNQRGLFWKQGEALVLSDLHVGKTAHFRKHGIPIPDDILQEDLHRLSGLIAYFNPKRLLIVGDLFHAAANKNMDVFLDWRSEFASLELTLIKGNHDRLPAYWSSKLDLKVIDVMDSPPFVFIHDPAEIRENQFCISGHLHPGVLIRGKGKQRLKLPCFTLTESLLILPAFSKFTGLNLRFSAERMRHYAFTENEFFIF